MWTPGAVMVLAFLAFAAGVFIGYLIGREEAPWPR